MTQHSSTQRNALLVAGGLTAFSLVLIGGVASRVAREAPQTPTAPAVAVAPTVAPTQGPDPAVQALIDQREAAYQQVIQEANDRLAQANARLAQAYARPPEPTQAPAPPKPAYIAAELAGQIAMIVAPGTTLTKLPELVNFQGTAAYEVILDAGTVYVDATSGQVLYNGAAFAMAQSGGGGGGGGSEHEGGEHEGDEHDG